MTSIEADLANMIQVAHQGSHLEERSNLRKPHGQARGAVEVKHRIRESDNTNGHATIGSYPDCVLMQE